jgi:hypothetical protein
MIEHYSFGEITVQGIRYTKDLIILCQGGSCKVYPNWWRKEGHFLQPEDLEVIWEARPEYLIVGTGASGVLRVDQRVIEKAKALGIKLEVARTLEAVKRFNELLVSASSLAGAFHLTC